MSAPVKNLAPGSRLLLLALCMTADENDEVRVKSGDLMEACGWKNRSSVRKHVKALEDAGLLIRVPTYTERGERAANIYHILREG